MQQQQGQGLFYLWRFPGYLEKGSYSLVSCSIGGSIEGVLNVHRVWAVIWAVIGFGTEASTFTSKQHEMRLPSFVITPLASVLQLSTT